MRTENKSLPLILRVKIQSNKYKPLENIDINHFTQTTIPMTSGKKNTINAKNNSAASEAAFFSNT